MGSGDYALLDSGGGRKLERFGPVVLDRPAAQAVWRPSLSPEEWARADAVFDREGGHHWAYRRPLPESWVIEIEGLKFRLSATDFGHLGIFPEQQDQWRWIRAEVQRARRAGSRPVRLLNLFAYSGGATLAAASAQAEVCHVDASRGMVEWARANLALNGLEHATVRWIVEDVHKFLRREERRGRQYDAIVLDPPSFGRGPSGEVYKIERDLMVTLELCRAVLSESPWLVLLTAHTPGLSPWVLQNALRQSLGAREGRWECGEMLLRGREGVYPLPNGSWARWSRTE